MHIFRSDKKILKAGKAAQGNYDRYFYIDPSTLIVYPVLSWESAHVNMAITQKTDIRVNINSSDLRPALDNLQKAGLLKKAPGGPCYQVTYQGWNHRSVVNAEHGRLLLTHVAFPSIVALITTLITLWLTR